jgi:hypothetical protein
MKNNKIKNNWIKIYLIYYIIYNKSIIIYIIVKNVMLPKFLGPICSNKKKIKQWLNYH